MLMLGCLTHIDSPNIPLYDKTITATHMSLDKQDIKSLVLKWHMLNSVYLLAVHVHMAKKQNKERVWHV